MEPRSDSVWSDLQRSLQRGDQFRTWSITGRARAIPFKIHGFEGANLIIERLSDGELYNIYRPSIERMAAIWPDYLAGRFPRSKMGEFTFASSYILGIFARLTGRIGPDAG